MTNNRSTKNNLPISLVLAFCISTVLFIIFKKQLQDWGVSTRLVIGGNILLFAATLASFLLYQRAMLHPTTMGFLRNTYSGLFLKLIVCLIAIVIYLFSVREHANKLGIIVCVFLYFVYSVLEMRSLLQWNKARRNA